MNKNIYHTYKGFVIRKDGLEESYYAISGFWGCVEICNTLKEAKKYIDSLLSEDNPMDNEFVLVNKQNYLVHISGRSVILSKKDHKEVKRFNNWQEAEKACEYSNWKYCTYEEYLESIN